MSYPGQFWRCRLAIFNTFVIPIHQTLLFNIYSFFIFSGHILENKNKNFQLQIFQIWIIWNSSIVALLIKTNWPGQVRSHSYEEEGPPKKLNRVTATEMEIKIWIYRDLVYYQGPSTWISRILYVGDLRSGQFRDLPIISQWGKNLSTSNTSQICSNRSEPCPFRLLLMTSMQICIWLCNPWKVIWGHILTSWVQYAFLLITFALIELETWDNR